jgi:hypothetical protein
MFGVHVEFYIIKTVWCLLYVRRLDRLVHNLCFDRKYVYIYNSVSALNVVLSCVNTMRREAWNISGAIFFTHV